MEAAIAAKQLRCSLCHERRPPTVQRPSSLPAPRQPGDQVAVDIFDSFDATGIRYSILHAMDAVTRFQMAVIVDKQSSEEVIRFLRERWAPAFGMPRTLLCDRGRAFVSHELEAFAAENTIQMAHIAAQASWQIGLCERTGGILKSLCLLCGSVLDGPG